MLWGAAFVYGTYSSGCTLRVEPLMQDIPHDADDRDREALADHQHRVAAKGLVMGQNLRPSLIDNRDFRGFRRVPAVK